MPKKDKIKEIYQKLSTPEERMLDALEKLADLEKYEGKPGKDYVLTEEDKQEISSMVEVPVIEKETIREIVKELPVVTNEIREVAIYPTPEEIRDLLRKLVGKERLSVFDLKDTEWLRGGKDKTNWSSAGFKVYTDASLVGDGSFGNPLKVAHSGSFGTWNEEYPTSGVVNSVNKVYVFLHTPSFISLDGQALSILNGDYTVIGNTVTLTNAPIDNPPINKFIS